MMKDAGKETHIAIGGNIYTFNFFTLPAKLSLILTIIQYLRQSRDLPPVICQISGGPPDFAAQI